ncbi:hypothetical protein DQ04_01031020 [Trypanosoma grayi]|uniref:hypothetical protein n=1 Tax=Trypanosoma grayi TaxID=71804 RepID=UPI0004F481E7|nr:hypothetical protein DQ04_01031020 [Trypanosoma grayi]KEG13389.1 hypothetical protein DQ04_01031020 [Trypanosoma grayi]
MAKSSRSKWKKLHKRQRAQQVAAAVLKRVDRLNGKLHLAAEGGLSAVPMEDPEVRFHFVNPEMDKNVPHCSKGPNNNYEDLTRESLDFTKPLRLQPPKTNYYGKSDPNMPHPVTQQFEVVNAVAPVAGHAISVEDVERMTMEEQRQAQQQQLSKSNVNDNEEDDNGMEEFVLGCNDAAGETSVNIDALLHGGHDGTVKKKSKKAGAAEAPRRISSMENPAKRNNRVVQVAGDKKTKRLSSVPAERLAKSSSSGAKRRPKVGQ